MGEWLGSKATAVAGAVMLACLGGTSATAATVITFTGHTTHGDPFEAIFRTNTPASSFTLNVGDDTTIVLPFGSGFTPDDNSVVIFGYHDSHQAITGEPGRTYLAGRLADFHGLSSSFTLVTNTAKPATNLVLFYRFIVDGHTVTTEPDLPGPVQVSLPAFYPGGLGLPEASTWALMVLGLGGLGAVLRTRRAKAVVA